MSKESAESFMERLKSDREFDAKAEGCQTIDDFIACAKQAGYDFSADEAQAVAGALSDEELEAVAGGRYVRRKP